MKKLFLTGIIFLAGATCFAQQRDPNAKVLLDAVSSKFQSYKSVVANFTMSILNSKGKSLSNKSGTITMKGQKYAVNMGGNKIVSDGNTVWNYDPASKEVTVNNANKAENTITPQKLLTDFYTKDFMYVLGGEKSYRGKKVQEVLLEPIDKKKPFSRVYLWIDKTASQIVSANIVEKTGNRFVYSINNLKPNTSVSDAQFVFNNASYPGVEVVDLR